MYTQHKTGIWWAAGILILALVVHAGGLLQARQDTGTDTAFVDRYLDVADEINPDMAERLRSMCALDEDRFGQVLRQLGPALAELTELRDSDPGLFQRKINELHLEATIESMAASIRAARSQGLDAAGTTAQLHALVEAQLSASMDTQQLYLDRMQLELERAQVQLEHQAEDFRGEVDERINRLLRP